MTDKVKTYQQVIHTKPRLTDKKEDFLKKYYDPNSPTHFNATKTAMVVYDCTEESASTVGPRILAQMRNLTPAELKEVGIAPAIREKLDEDLTAESILNGLNKIRKSAKREADRIKASELIGKFKDLSLWRDHQITEDVPSKPETEESLIEEFKHQVSKN